MLITIRVPDDTMHIYYEQESAPYHHVHATLKNIVAVNLEEAKHADALEEAR